MRASSASGAMEPTSTPRHLLQHDGHVLDGKALPLHATPSWPTGRIVTQNSRWRWTEYLGAPHIRVLNRLTGTGIFRLTGIDD